MAIYKPSNCYPYLSTIDLFNEDQLPHYLECKLDTSNTTVTAYSIVIYDEENNQIFPTNPASVNYSFVSDLASQNIPSNGTLNLNSGLNGSYLRIPFVVNGNKVSKEDANTIYIINEVAQDKNGETVNIKNGYSYKWVITLYQGVTEDGSLFPESYYTFDMVLTSGQIMGTTNERIQSPLSENIYIDYFMQPVKINGFLLDNSNGQWSYEQDVDNSDPISISQYSRVRIKNYDNSFGYVYPQTGDYGFPSELFVGENKPDGFQIFRMSNDPNILTTTQKVSLVGNAVVPWVWNSMPANQSTSYGIQTYYVPEEFYVSGVYYPFDVEYDGNFEKEIQETEERDIPIYNRYVLNNDAITYGVQVGNRIVLTYQLQNNSDYNVAPEGETYELNTKGSAFNGIYSIQQEDNPVIVTINNKNYYKIVLRWKRTSDANTWGSLINKIVYVEGGAEDFANLNIQPIRYQNDKPIDNTSVLGMINESPLMFDNETPIEIYSHPPVTSDGGEGTTVSWEKNIYRNTIAPIFYNETTKNDEGNIQSGRLYIRPFVGLANNMWFQYMIPNSDGYNFIISNVNTEFWYVEYDGIRIGRSTVMASINEDPFTIGGKYQIRSFYRIGDEIPFYCADTPKLEVHYFSNQSQNVEYIPITKEQKYLEPDGTASDEDIPSSFVDYIGITQRTLYCIATYSQPQGIQWKSFQWRLEDENGIVIDESDVVYSGKIEHTFYGLLYRSTYVVYLTVENQSGVYSTLNQSIHTIYGEIANSTFPAKVSIDCALTAAILDFTGVGYVLPNQTGNRLISPTKNDTKPSISGVNYQNGYMKIGQGVGKDGVYYDKVSSEYLRASALNDIVVNSDSITIEEKSQIIDKNFYGVIWKIDGTPENAEDKTNFTFSAFIPNTISEDGQVSQNRNTIQYNLINNATQQSQNGIFSIPNGIYDNDQWIDGAHLVFTALGPWECNIDNSSPIIASPSGDVPSLKVSFIAGAIPWILGERNYSQNYQFSQLSYGLSATRYSNIEVDTDGEYPSQLPAVELETIYPPLRPLSTTYRTFNVLGNDEMASSEFHVAQTAGGNAWEPFGVQNKVPVLWSDCEFEAKNVVIGASINVGVSGQVETGLESGIAHPKANGQIHYVGMNLLTNNIWYWNDSLGGNISYWDDGVVASEDGKNYVNLQLQNQYNFNYEKSLLEGQGYTFVLQLTGLNNNAASVVKAEAYRAE